ncbi:alpha/beta hydrolase [Rubripirellula amarantea]|nr:alpha/beta hydrolase [Rubripirellula amarantea]
MLLIELPSPMKLIYHITVLASVVLSAGTACSAPPTTDAANVENNASKTNTNKKANSRKPQPDEILFYKKVGDVDLTLHIFRPDDSTADQSRPAIVFFFGGGWVSGSPQQFYPQAKHLASQGMVAICADYRTQSRHQTPPTACVADGKSAIRYVRSHAASLGINPNQIAAGGGSAGGHVAASTAALTSFDDENDDTSVSCRPNALVLFNPVFDNGPNNWGHKKVKAYWQEISPAHNLHADMPATLVMLGTSDNLIPVSTAENFQTKLQSLGVRCELKLYDNQPHGFFNKAKYKETVQDMDVFLRSLGYLQE